MPGIGKAPPETLSHSARFGGSDSRTVHSLLECMESVFVTMVKKKVQMTVFYTKNHNCLKSGHVHPPSPLWYRFSKKNHSNILFTVIETVILENEDKVVFMTDPDEISSSGTV